MTSTGDTAHHGGAWPALPYDEWKGTCTSLHLWSQVVGKVRLARSPWINHSWHATFYVTPRGLTTSAIPAGERNFELAFDFVDHRLRLLASDGAAESLPLEAGTVAGFHARLMAALDGLGLATEIVTQPNEIPDAVPFEDDTEERDYVPDHAHRFWQALVRIDRVMRRFRARFTGKCSPVHLFWGSFDMAVTRFSGREAPQHPAGFPNLPDAVAREAYSHEVSSAGFWPGGEAYPEPIFYSYAYPEPEGFRDAEVRGPGAHFLEEMGEFVLPYERVRRADDPDAALLDFFQSTYEAAAELAEWDREALEWPEGSPFGERAGA